MRWKILAVGCAVSLLVGACNKDELSRNIAYLDIVPQPEAGHVVLSDPPGIDLGKVPLFGTARAVFQIENDSVAKLVIDSIEVESATGGTFVPTLIVTGQTEEPVQNWPFEMESQDKTLLFVDFTPESADEEGTGVIVLKTNAGKKGNEEGRAQVVGTGWFIGVPNLEIEYNGLVHQLPNDCTFADGSDVCTLSDFDFGNVQLGGVGNSHLFLRNVPPADTCRLPDASDGTPNCDPVCTVTFDRDENGRDLGIGFVPADVGFSFLGATPVPFSLSPSRPECSGEQEGNLVWGELDLVVNFHAGTTQEDDEALLILESNDPGEEASSYRGRIEIPVKASTREAPIAIATVRECGEGVPPTSCSDPTDLRPLGRVYFDGSESHDPRGGMIVSHRWELIRFPAGASSNFADYDPQGANSPYFDMYLPLAGTYQVRLHVTNDADIESGISTTSDVEVVALPDSRVHIQLVWDHPSNDQDLHVIYADGNEKPFHKTYDCFWRQCRPSCVEDEDCCVDDPDAACPQPAWWFTDADLFDGPNPRLDIDDTNGLGPENINIDEPRAGRYRVFVHYYGLENPADVRTQVTIRLYIDGELRNEYKRALYKNDLWAVAELTWNADGSSDVRAATSDGENVIGSVQQLIYLPFPDGFDFGPVF